MTHAFLRLARCAPLVALVISVGACTSSSSSNSTTSPTPTITAVAVSGAAPSVNATTQFTATATLSDSTTQSATAQATWSSSNTAVATVSAGGVVTGVTAGSADIRATYQNFTGAKGITIDSAPPCAFTVSPMSVNVRAAGEPAVFTVAVTQGSNCNWTATSSSAFITMTNGATGTGGGTVAFAVAANTGEFRTGTVTIAGQARTVTQEAAGICVTSVSPTSESFTSSGGTGTVTVAAPDTCGWHVQTNDAFVLVSEGTRGNGNGTFTYSVVPNTTSALREGSVSVGGRLLTVAQQGTCQTTVSPSSFDLDGGPATIAVNIATTGSCDWSASSDSSFATLPDGQTGVGNGSVTIAVAQNDNGSPRTARLTVAGHTVTLTQDTCRFSVTPSDVTVRWGENVTNISVTTSFPACRWTEVIAGPFLQRGTIDGVGSGTAAIHVPQNSSSLPRTSAMIVANRTVTITQLGAGTSCVAISPASVAPPVGGGSFTFAVTNACTAVWSATSQDSFISVTAASNSTASGSLTIDVQPNATGAARTGTVVVGDSAMTVAQAGP